MNQRGLLDTSVFVAREFGRPLDAWSIPPSVAISVITLAELRAGVLAAPDPETTGRRLRTLEEASALRPIAIDEDVAEKWAALRTALRVAGRRMPINDSWIAATAMALGAAVVTQDTDYDVGIAGREVISV